MHNKKMDMSRLSVLQKEQVNDVMDYEKSQNTFCEMEEDRLFLKKKRNSDRLKKQLKDRRNWTMGLVVVLFVIGLVFLSYVLSKPSLHLTQMECEIEQGEVFDAMAYISSWSNLRGTLYLPENIDTSRTGSQLAVYRLEAGGRQIVETLVVKVK